MAIKIDKQFKALIPPLSPEEFAGLEAAILRDGCRDPLVLWEDKAILLDGHNRKEICDKHNLPYNITELAFDSREAAQLWIIKNQFDRRNLTPFQRAELAIQLKPLIAAMAKANQKQAGKDKLPQNPAEALDTRDELAKIAGVSHDTISKVQKVLESHLPVVILEARRGDISVNAAAEIATKTINGERMPSKAHVSNNSGNNEWYTPEEYIKAATAVMGGIDLDPASSDTANKVVGAKRFYTEEQDGLSKKWKGRVWMNPPYAQPTIGLFIDKLVESVKSGDVTEAVVIVNNATETKWFQALLKSASAVCFLASRVRFWYPNRESFTPLQGQAVLYFGAQQKKFHSNFTNMGTVCYVER